MCAWIALDLFALNVGIWVSVARGLWKEARNV